MLQCDDRGQVRRRVRERRIGRRLRARHPLLHVIKVRVWSGDRAAGPDRRAGHRPLYCTMFCCGSFTMSNAAPEIMPAVSFAVLPKMALSAAETSFERFAK